METVAAVFLQSGYWIKILVFFCAAVAVLACHGLFWSIILKLRLTLPELPAVGLISVLAIEELTSWYIVAYRLSANLLLVTTLASVLLPAAAGVVLWALRRKKREQVLQKAHFHPILLALAIVFLAVVLAGNTVEYYTSNDDSFYVSNVALFAGSPTVNPYDSSMGDPTTRSFPMYDFETWEALVSVVCRITGLKATETMHTLLIPPLLLCAFSAVFMLGWRLLKHRYAALMFAMLVILYYIGGRYYKYGEGAFLLRRLWQGKAMNLHIVLPVLSACTMMLFEDREDGERGNPLAAVVMTSACVIAGMGLNPTSLYVNGFELLFLSLAMCVLTKKWNLLTGVIPAVVLTGIFTLMLYLRTSQCQGLIENASVVADGFVKKTMDDFFRDKKDFLILGLVSLIYIVCSWKKGAGAYFAVTPLMMLAFIWNPWTGKLVAEHITKEPTYWRVFWLLPVGAGIAYAMSDLTWRQKSWKTAGVAALCVLTLYYTGGGIGKYTVTANVEKQPEAVLTIAQTLKNEGIETPVLADSVPAAILRQDNPEILLLVAKRHYIDEAYTYFGRTEEGEDRKYLYDFVNGELEQFDKADELLRKYNVGCIVIANKNKEEIAYLQETGWKARHKATGYRLYYRSK